MFHDLKDFKRRHTIPPDIMSICSFSWQNLRLFGFVVYTERKNQAGSKIDDSGYDARDFWLFSDAGGPLRIEYNNDYIRLMIRIGTQGWSYKDWVGNFYPEGCRQEEYLSVYAGRFNTVEVDSSFYGIPRKSTVARWYDSVSADFKFAAKFPRQITHESDLTGVEDILSGFLKAMSGLKEKLGPLLLQFPYSFKPEMAENLYKFLNLLPAEYDFVVEVRNKKWLDDRFYDALRQQSIGLALIDHPWMPEVPVATSRVLYVRFLGSRKMIPDDFSHERYDRSEDLSRWTRLIRVLEEKTDDFYGYFNNHYSGHSPTTAERFKEMMAFLNAGR